MTLPISEFFQAALAQVCQIAALVVVVAFIVRRFCRARPHLAYMLWLLVIVKCLTPPIWSSPLGLFSLAQIDVLDEQPTGTPTATAGPFGASGNSPTGWTAPTDDIARLGAETAAMTGDSTLFASTTTLVGWIWLAGAILMVGAIIIGWTRCRRTIARCPREADPNLQQRVSDLARRLRIRRPIEVILSEEPVGPAVFGIIKPKLILPRTLVDSRSFEEIEPVIAHELIHVRRHDAAMMVMELMAKIVWWFHPLVWWAGRHIGRQRERCCDAETVASLACRPAEYARCLLDVLEHKQELRTAFLLPGVRPVEVTSKRLEEIMRRASTFRSRTPRSCWAIAVLAALLVLPGSPLVIETETDAMIALFKRVDGDEQQLLQMKSSGKLSSSEAGAIAKLESIFGKLEDFAQNSRKDEIGELLEASIEADLSVEETKAAVKLAAIVEFELEVAKRLQKAGRLSDVEAKALEKLEGSLER